MRVAVASLVNGCKTARLGEVGKVRLQLEAVFDHFIEHRLCFGHLASSRSSPPDRPPVENSPRASHAAHQERVAAVGVRKRRSCSSCHPLPTPGRSREISLAVHTPTRRVLGPPAAGPHPEAGP